MSCKRQSEYSKQYGKSSNCISRAILFLISHFSDGFFDHFWKEQWLYIRIVKFANADGNWKLLKFIELVAL